MRSTPARFLLLPALLGASLSAGTFTVTTTADSVSPVIPGSLRWAIIQANNTPGPDVIQFAIPGAGVQTIVVQSALPALTDMAGVLIDGLSQPGASAGANPPSTATLMIELAGYQAGFSATGITVQSDNNVVRGLVVNRFAVDGIHVQGPANQSANNNLIYCNFVGTDATGTSGQGNGLVGGALRGGIHVSNVQFGVAVNNVIDRNLSSRNWAEGIWIEGPRVPGDVGFTEITDNYVGTDRTGTMDLGNHHEGVALTEGTHDNQVLRNLVSGNDTDGIGIQGFDNLGLGAPIYTHHNLVEDNLVGVDVNIQPLPNTLHGIAIGQYGLANWGFADWNTIRTNVIAYNGNDGIAVVETFNVNTTNADHNRITQNSIWGNGGLGIDLGDNGVTFNDPGDFDSGPNEELNRPVITSVTNNVFTTMITIQQPAGAPLPIAAVEVFAARNDPSGSGEGEWYIGSASLVAGNWQLTTNLLAQGDLVTATMTDVANNTSEFAQNQTVPGNPSLTIDSRQFPARTGGIVNFSMDAGPSNAGDLYLIVASLSGTAPGTSLGSITVPLVADPFTNVVLAFTPSPLFPTFFGNLDAAGQGTGQMNLVGQLNQSWAGAKMYFAFILFPFDFASNPVAVEVTPW